MKSRLVVMAALLLLVAFVGCGKKVDQEELNEANNLIDGLNMLGMMTDVDAYSSSYLMAPPLGWNAIPETIDVPNTTDWPNNVFYRFVLKFPLDSMGTFLDSISWLAMLTPDVWDTATGPATQIDVGLLADTRNIWFHTIIAIDTHYVTGSMKWNWEETWYSYAYSMSHVLGDTSGSITITTSPNINLSAHFLFDYRGAGHEADNYGQFGSVVFVRFEFFAEPDPDNYNGYFTLLSENWKVQHYFPEHQATF